MASRDLEFALKFTNDASSALKAATADLQQFGAVAAQVAKSLQSFNSAGIDGTTTASLKLANAYKTQEIRAASLAIAEQKLDLQKNALTITQERQRQQTERLSLSAQKLQQQQERAAKGTSLLSGAFGTLYRALAPVFALLAVTKLATMADDMALYRYQLQGATANQNEFNKVFDALSTIGQKTKIGLQGPTELWQRLQAVKGSLGANTDQLLQFTDALATLGKTSGAGPEVIAQVMNNIGKSFTATTVNARTFSQILNDMPELAQAVAEQFGTDVVHLRAAVEQGKVLSKDVFGAISNTLDESNAKLEKMPKTFSGALKGFVLDLQQVAAILGDASGGANTFAAILKFAGDVVKNLARAFAILWDEIKIVYNTAKLLVNLMTLGVEGIKAAWTAAIEVLKTIFGGFLNTAIDGLNAIITGINKFKTDKIELIAHVQIGTTDENGQPKTFSEILQDQLGKSSDVATDIGDVQDALSGVSKATADGTKNLNDLNKSVAEFYGTAPAVEKTATAFYKISDSSAKAVQNVSTLTDTQRSFVESLRDQIALMQLETAQVGLSNRVKERANAIEKVRQAAVKANVDPKNSVKQFTDAYDALQTAQDQQHSDFTAGLKQAFTDYTGQLKGMGDLAQDVFKKSTDGVSGIIDGFVDGSINSFSDLRKAVANILSDVAGDLAKFAIKQAIFGSFAAGTGGSTSGSLLGSIGSAFGFTASAKGNAFVNGRLKKYAKGGVTNGPELFPLRGGNMGLRGEAGPEGVLPLRRLSNGDLGVQAQGSGGGGVFNYMPTIQVSVDSSGARETSSSGGGNLTDLARLIDSETRKTVYDVLTKEQRAGGMLVGGRGKSV